MCGTAMFMLFTAGYDQDAFKVGVVYALLYCIFRQVFKGSKAMFNPTIVFAELMSGACDICEAILFWICQGVGAFIGYLVHSSVTGEAAVQHDASFDFFTVVVSEFVGASILVWLWLEIHSKKDTWSENFYGFAPGIMYFIAMSFINKNACLNPAKYEAQWFTASVQEDGWGAFKGCFSRAFTADNMTYALTPIVAAFVTSLVHAWAKK